MKWARIEVPNNQYLKLPRTAHKFINSNEGKNCDIVVYKLHSWLSTKNIELSTLTPEVLKEFLNCPLRKAVSKVTDYNYRRHISLYLHWLYRHRQIHFDPDLIRKYPKGLPHFAEKFLESLQSSLKPSSISGHRTAVRRLNFWLRTNKITLNRFKRPHVHRFSKYLMDEGLHPATRCDMLKSIRIYFRWLNDCNMLSENADELITASDFPKLPQYLPRPFSKEIDTKLQEFLRNSKDIHLRALLLMRYTGLRIGELINLKKDCVHTDLKDHKYLKVPLGKMNNERMVPLDKRSVDLIDSFLQGQNNTSQWLIECAPGKKTNYAHYRSVLIDLSKRLGFSESLLSHRLRHTYATELMNAGMNIQSIMKLLGHKDYRMTLRYSSVTLETVTEEYTNALAKIEQKYLPESLSNLETDPVRQIYHIIQWLQKNALGKQTIERHSDLIIKRLRKMQHEIGIVKSSIDNY